MARIFGTKSFLMLCALTLTSCATFDTAPSVPHLTLSPIKFDEIKGWDKADLKNSLSAFQKSCARILKSSSDKEFGFGIKMADWQDACRHITDTDARHYFEDWFTPYRAEGASGDEGLLTGYYEPLLKASSVKTSVYNIPLRARPADLVMVNLGEFLPELKGKKIAGRVTAGQLKPYEDRKAIEAGKLPKDMDVPLYWTDSAVDAFFLQIQGSGVLSLPDGTTQRIGYDGQNGYPYTAIGKELIARGALTKDTVSMQTIRDWLATHPAEATEVMQTNQSYVFFKKLDGAAPLGAEGVELTPEASMAVDHTIWPYGLPIFINAKHPQGDDALQRLMIAQDTGGAIKGIIRGDFFWGHSDTATLNAGLLKSPLSMTVLLPKNSVPTVKE